MRRRPEPSPAAVAARDEADRVYTRRWITAHNRFACTEDLRQAMEDYNDAMEHAEAAWKVSCAEAAELDTTF